MKKIIFLFSLMVSIAKGDYLTTNGKIALFYDENINRIEYVRGDIYDLLDISQMEIYFLKDNVFYPISKGMYSVTRVGINLLELEYKIDNSRVRTYVFSSMKNKSNLYLYTDTSELSWKEPFEIVYMLSPMKNTDSFQYKNGYYYYGNKLKINSLENKGQLFFASPEDFQNQRMISGKENLKKTSRDRLYFFSKIKNKFVGDKLLINLSDNEYYLNGSTRDLLEENINYWLEFNKKYNFLKKNIRNQMEILDILGKVYEIPKAINYNKSNKNFYDRLRIEYIQNLYGQKDRQNTLLENIFIEPKDNFEKIQYYNYILETMELGGLTEGEKIYRKNLQPKIKQVIENIIASKIQLNNENDFEKYYEFYKFLNKYENYIEEDQLKNNIVLYRNNLCEELRNNIEGLISNSELNGKIKYLDIYDNSIKKEILEKIHKTYYNSRVGVLSDPEFPDEINMQLNLEYVLRLYENNDRITGDIIFARLEGLIKSNDGYIIPKMKIIGKNYPGIYTHVLYLYFKILQYRGMEWI